MSLTEVVKGYAEAEAINQRARQFEEHARTFEQQSTRPSPRRSARPARPTSSGSNISVASWPTSIPKSSTGSRNIPPTLPARAARRRSSSTSAAAWRESPAKCSASRPRAQSQYQAQAQAAAQAGSRLRRMGQTGVQAKNRHHRHRDAEQCSFQQCVKSVWKSTASTNRRSEPYSTPRMLHVLRDASEHHRRLTAKQTQTSHAGPRTHISSGEAQGRPNTGSAARRRIDDALKTQARTGGSIERHRRRLREGF